MGGRSSAICHTKVCAFKLTVCFQRISVYQVLAYVITRYLYLIMVTSCIIFFHPVTVPPIIWEDVDLLIVLHEKELRPFYIWSFSSISLISFDWTSVMRWWGSQGSIIMGTILVILPTYQYIFLFALLSFVTGKKTNLCEHISELDFYMAAKISGIA